MLKRLAGLTLLVGSTVVALNLVVSFLLALAQLAPGYSASQPEVNHVLTQTFTLGLILQLIGGLVWASLRDVT